MLGIRWEVKLVLGFAFGLLLFGWLSTLGPGRGFAGQGFFADGYFVVDGPDYRPMGQGVTTTFDFVSGWQGWEAFQHWESCPLAWWQYEPYLNSDFGVLWGPQCTDPEDYLGAMSWPSLVDVEEVNGLLWWHRGGPLNGGSWLYVYTSTDQVDWNVVKQQYKEPSCPGSGCYESFVLDDLGIDNKYVAVVWRHHRVFGGSNVHVDTLTMVDWTGDGGDGGADDFILGESPLCPIDPDSPWYDLGFENGAYLTVTKGITSVYLPFQPSLADSAAVFTFTTVISDPNDAMFLGLETQTWGNDNWPFGEFTTEWYIWCGEGGVTCTYGIKPFTTTCMSCLGTQDFGREFETGGGYQGWTFLVSGILGHSRNFSEVVGLRVLNTSDTRSGLYLKDFCPPAGAEQYWMAGCYMEAGCAFRDYHFMYGFEYWQPRIEDLSPDRSMWITDSWLVFEPGVSEFNGVYVEDMRWCSDLYTFTVRAQGEGVLNFRWLDHRGEIPGGLAVGDEWYSMTLPVSSSAPYRYVITNEVRDHYGQFEIRALTVTEEVAVDWLCAQSESGYVPFVLIEDADFCGPFPALPDWESMPERPESPLDWAEWVGDLLAAIWNNVKLFFAWVWAVIKWLWCMLVFWLRRLWRAILGLAFEGLQSIVEFVGLDEIEFGGIDDILRRIYAIILIPADLAAAFIYFLLKLLVMFSGPGFFMSMFDFLDVFLTVLLEREYAAPDLVSGFDSAKVRAALLAVWDNGLLGWVWDIVTFSIVLRVFRLVLRFASAVSSIRFRVRESAQYPLPWR